MDMLRPDIIERMKRLDETAALLYDDDAGRRGKDDTDIGAEQVLRDINWEVLDALAKEIPQFLLNDRKANEFKSAYDDYVTRYRK
jgi:3-methyladenine DNA glycosylase AlkD